MTSNKSEKFRNTANPQQVLGEGEERLKSLFELSSEWYWEQDEHYRHTQITGEAFEKAGFDTQDYLGVTRWDRGGWPVGDGGSWDKHKATLEARQPFTDFLYKRPNPHGELRYISCSGRSVFDDQGQFRGYRGIAGDVTQRVQTELRLSLEHGVTHVLAESESIAEAAPQIISVICQTLGWSCGARWVPDERGEAIRCAETWGVASAEIDSFLESTRRQAPSTQLGGLNRRAWIQGEPLWIRDVTKDATFRRASEASKAGLRSAFAFPIKVGAQSIGVMEFFSREIHQPDAELLNGTRYIGSQIGQFMQRKQAEAALRESEERFRTVVDSANEGILVYDRSLHVIGGNVVAERIIGLQLADIIGAAGFTSLLPCVDADGAPLRPEDRPTRITIRTGSPLTGQILGIKRSDGSVTWLSVNTGVLRRPGESDYYGVVSTFGDVSVQRQAEAALRESEARFRHLTNLSSDWFWEQDAELRFTRMEGRHVTGDNSAFSNELGKTLWEIGVEVGSGNEEYRAQLKTHQPFRDVVMKRTSQDGQRHYMSVSGEPIFDDENRFIGYRGVGKDVTEHKREELLLALEHTVTRCLSQADSVSGALKSVIRAICESQGWECGRYFYADTKANLLRFGEAWGIPDAAIERYIADSRKYSSPLNKGWKAGVWRTGEPLWTAEMGQHGHIGRAYLGSARHSFVFAVISEGKSLGVLSFTSREVRKPDERLLQATRVIGSQIGQFLQRKQAEEVVRESEARFRSLTGLSSDWFWEQDAEFRFTRMKGQHPTGDRSAFQSELGKTYDEIGIEVEGGWDAHRALLQAHQPFRDVTMWRRLQDGQLRYVSVSGEPMFDDEERFIGYRGVGKDITEHKREEQLLALEHTVNRSLADAKSASEAIRASMCAVCETEGWECGRYLRVDERAGVLRFGEAWSVPSAEIERYIEESRGMVYAPGVGVVGRVWQSGQPLWVADIGQDARVARATLARETGMHGSFAVAVLSEGQTIGVLIFHSREVREPEERLLQAIRVIGSQIGQFMQRKQAEQALRESEERFRSLTELSSDWFWEQDAEFRFTRLEGQHVTGDNSAFDSELDKTYGEIGVELESGNEEYRTQHETHQPFRDVVMKRTFQDGKVYYISVSGEPILDDQNHFIGYRGVGKDITVHKREEQLLALEHTVNRCLADAKSASEAIKTSLRAVCETEGWECGRYFRLDQKAGVLRFAEAWSISDPLIERYIAASDGITYARGVGLIGKVCQSGEPLWVSERSHQHHGLSRAILGKDRDRFIFPLIADGKILGVCNFISRKLRTPDARLLQAVRVIGSQIGQYMQRKQAEQATLQLGKMFAALSATNDAILHAESPETLYQQVCDAAVHHGEFSNTSLLLAEESTSRMSVVAGAGRVPQQLRVSHISIDETIPQGQGLVGIAYRTQQPCISNDFLNDERTRPWHEMGHKTDCRSAAALPLIQGGRSIGAILIHYDELNAFDEEIVKLLERMAENVSFALDNFAHEAEHRQAQEHIQYLATHDGLTDLPNRVMFGQMLTHTIQSAQRYHHHFAVLFLDLDRFKIINDTLGHDAGDMLLQEMARRVKESLRSSDVVARLGGDEFVVLVQGVNELEQITTVARKLLSTVIKPVVIREQECRVTASIGISVYPTDGEDEQALMKNADVAMYLAKEQGKNNFQFYSKDIKAQSLERLTLETSLRRVLEREELFLHYQAKLDLTTEAITGVEALVRWQHPDLGMVPPMQFIPLAEEIGLIVPIGKWVLKTACAQNVAWQRAGLPPVCVAVNLSPHQFNDEQLLRDLAAVLQETGLAPDLLELEITESMVMGNVDRAAKKLAAIKQMGVRLAIDDFGTGYSSLAQIKRFPIDTIKVDRSFIREIPQNSQDKAITEAIIAMGKTLSLTVVAEGVETQAQQTFLREHACNEMQGYYFSKPVAPDQFAKLLRTHVPFLSPQSQARR